MQCFLQSKITFEEAALLPRARPTAGGVRATDKGSMRVCGCVCTRHRAADFDAWPRSPLRSSPCSLSILLHKVGRVEFRNGNHGVKPKTACALLILASRPHQPVESERCAAEAGRGGTSSPQSLRGERVRPESVRLKRDYKNRQPRIDDK